MEIERKFLVKKLPDLSGVESVDYERYYLSVSDGVEERIQKTGDTYSYERKTSVDALTRSTELRHISKTEFDDLRQNTTKAILRQSYSLSSSLSIKIYHGDYEGLIRAEIEFSSLEEAKAYQPEPWMGREITNTPLGRDSSLLKLNSDSVVRLIEQLAAEI